jgi:hypothetical protein
VSELQTKPTVAEIVECAAVLDEYAKHAEALAQLRAAAQAQFPALLFDQDAADQAADAWGLNCGPAAIAAISGRSLDRLRPHLGDFELKRYTNPTLMFEILRNLGVRFATQRVGLQERGTKVAWPAFGLARVQWEGPWMNAGVPVAARYRKTHWAGAGRVASGEQWVFDVNCLSVGGWVSAAEWEGYVVPWIVKVCVPKGTGAWHLTHVIEVTR